MKFFRTDPGLVAKAYSDYRDFTRSDFRGTCAYCFRHEDDAGGSGHYEQDHFKPQSQPGVDPSEYLNLYWSCRDCNSRRHKSNKWPTKAELKIGMCFCDPCKCNPFSRDYVVLPDGLLEPRSNAGTYTIDAIHLNERPDLKVHRRLQKTERAMLIEKIEYMKQVRAGLNPAKSTTHATRYAEVGRIIAVYESAAYAKPFVLRRLHDLPDLFSLRDTLLKT